MKKLLSIVAAAIFMVSCGMTDKAKQVDYTEAHGYFVRNDAPPHLSCYYDSRRRSTVFSVVQPLWEKVVHPLK